MQKLVIALMLSRAAAAMTFTAEDDAIPSADQKIIKTVKCRGYAFCGELGDESPAEVTGVAKLEVTVKDIAMKQS